MKGQRTWKGCRWDWLWRVQLQVQDILRSISRGIKRRVKAVEERAEFFGTKDSRQVQGKDSRGEGGHMVSNKDKAMVGNRIAVQWAVDKMGRDVPDRKSRGEVGDMSGAEGNGQRDKMTEKDKAL